MYAVSTSDGIVLASTGLRVRAASLARHAHQKPDHPAAADRKLPSVDLDEALADVLPILAGRKTATAAGGAEATEAVSS